MIKPIWVILRENVYLKSQVAIQPFMSGFLWTKLVVPFPNEFKYYQLVFTIINLHLDIGVLLSVTSVGR